MNSLRIWFLATTLVCMQVVAQPTLNWSAAVDIAPSSSGNLHPRIVLDAAAQPVIMFGQSNTGRIRIARWNGSSFVNQIINSGTMPAFYENWAGPNMASKGDTIYVVFKQTPEEKNHVYCMASYDGAKTWMKPVAVDTIADSLSRFATVSVDDKANPVVAFMKFAPDYTQSRWAVSRSTDGGRTFLRDVKASGFSGGTVCDCCPGTVLSSGDRIAMLYRDNDKNLRDTWMGVSNDNGQLFSTGTNIDRNTWMINACPATGPDGVMIGDSVFSVFVSAATGKSLVYHNGVSLSSTLSIKARAISSSLSGIVGQNYPRIAAHNRSIAEVWVQQSGSASSIMMNYSPDISKGFSDNIQIVSTGAPGSMINADVAVSGDKVYVVYQDDASGKVQMRSASLPTSAVDEADDAQSLQARFLSGNLLEWNGSALLGAVRRVQLWTSLGALVCEATASQASLTQIETPQLSNGCYVLSVEFESGLRKSTTVLKP